MSIILLVSNCFRLPLFFVTLFRVSLAETCRRVSLAGPQWLYMTLLSLHSARMRKMFRKRVFSMPKVTKTADGCKGNVLGLRPNGVSSTKANEFNMIQTYFHQPMQWHLFTSHCRIPPKTSQEQVPGAHPESFFTSAQVFALCWRVLLSSLPCMVSH